MSYLQALCYTTQYFISSTILKVYNIYMLCRGSFSPTVQFYTCYILHVQAFFSDRLRLSLE